jgi:hypothetical protein
METNELFITASRNKTRFTTTNGVLSTEDLWDLSLKSLDQIAVRLDNEMQPSRKSFLENPDPKADLALKEDQLRLEILKVVIGTKQDENKAKLEAGEKKRRREFLENLLEKKKIGEMESLSAEQIEAELAAMAQ